MSDITSGPARCWEDVYRAQTARIQELETEIAELREDRGRLTALVDRLEEWINYLTENMLRPGGAAETPLREIDALRGRIREAYSMLRPDTFWQGGDIYKPVVRLPELERWETTPEVQRELGCREKQPNRNFRWFRGKVDGDLVRRMNEAAALEEER